VFGCISLRHRDHAEAGGLDLMFGPISVEFTLMWWYNIGFDTRWDWLQRSDPVKPSSSVTLMTSPQGCHESVHCWPSLPRSMCVWNAVASVGIYYECYESQKKMVGSRVWSINTFSHFLIRVKLLTICPHVHKIQSCLCLPDACVKFHFQTRSLGARRS